mgnify:CR=1 FL=1
MNGETALMALLTRKQYEESCVKELLASSDLTQLDPEDFNEKFIGILDRFYVEKGAQLIFMI